VFLVRHFCPDDAADIGSRDAQDLGDLVLEHEEGAIPVVPPVENLDHDVVRVDARGGDELFVHCRTDVFVHHALPFSRAGPTAILSMAVFPARDDYQVIKGRPGE